MGSEFFENDTPHGLVKRIMYKKYLQAFVPVTQNAKPPLKTVIIDGFAGTERYGEAWPKETEKYGSPLIALMVSLNFFYKKQHGKDKIWGKPQTDRDIEAETADLFANMELDDTGFETDGRPTIELYFVEQDPGVFKKLWENIAEVLTDFFTNPDTSYTEKEIKIWDLNGVEFCVSHPHYPITCYAVNASFTDFKPPPDIRNGTRCLVFLDPFGYSDTPMKHVKKFVLPGVSVLINFMSSFVNRFLSANLKPIQDLYETQYLIERTGQWNLIEDLDMYVLHLSQEFKPGYRQPLGNIERCAARYEECLRTAFNSNLSLSFEIRGKNNCIIYHLIFITQHEKSLKIMKESMNRCSQVENGFAMSDYTVYRNGSKLNLVNTQDVHVVADAIYAQFQGSKGVSISDVEKYVLLNTPYVFRKKPLAVMMKGDDPRITAVYDVNGRPPRRRGTFPDHTFCYLDFC